MTPLQPVPAWLDNLVARIDEFPAILGHEVPPLAHPRRSAVLVLIGQDRDGAPDVLLTQRAVDLRSHPGQIAFPGGSIDPTDSDAIKAALREAHEETGLDLEGVHVLGEMPDLYVWVSRFVVTPVLAWWARPSEVGPGDPAEVAQVVRVPIAELLDPANRFMVHIEGIEVGPGFVAQELFIWGFTARLLDLVLSEGGLEKPWDTGRFANMRRTPEGEVELESLDEFSSGELTLRPGSGA